MAQAKSVYQDAIKKPAMEAKKAYFTNIDVQEKHLKLWCQFNLQEAKTVDSLVQEQKQLLGQLPFVSNQNLHIGKRLLALYAVDNQWYRAEVLSFPVTGRNGVVDGILVKFIDFGNDDVNQIGDLRELQNQQLVEVRPMAQLCYVLGAAAIGPTWAPDAVKKLNDLVCYEHLPCSCVCVFKNMPVIEVFVDENFSTLTDFLVHAGFADPIVADEERKRLAVVQAPAALPPILSPPPVAPPGLSLAHQPQIQGVQSQLTSQAIANQLPYSQTFPQPSIAPGYPMMQQQLPMLGPQQLAQQYGAGQGFAYSMAQQYGGVAPVGFQPAPYHHQMQMLPQHYQSDMMRQNLAGSGQQQQAMAGLSSGLAVNTGSGASMVTQSLANLTLATLPSPQSVAATARQYPRRSLQKRQRYDVTVCFLRDPSDFYLRLNSWQDDLITFMAVLNNYYTIPRNRRPLSVVQPNVLCIAMHDDLWYRGIVREVRPSGLVVVRYVDYGSDRTVKSSDLAQICDEFVKEPVFAIQSCFNTVKLRGHYWSEDEVAIFHKIVANVQCMGVLIDDEGVYLWELFNSENRNSIAQVLNDRIEESKMAAACGAVAVHPAVASVEATLSAQSKVQSADVTEDIAGQGGVALEAEVDKGADVVVQKLSDLQENENCVIIGTIYKQQELKPNILKEVALEANVIPQPVRSSKLTDADDKIILEDENLRVLLTGNVNINEFVTGVTVGLYGCVLESGSFNVFEVIYAGLPAPEKTSLPSEPDRPDSYVLLVSGLSFGNQICQSSDQLLRCQMLADWLSGFLGGPEEQDKISRISRVIIAGDSISGDLVDKNHGQLARYLARKVNTPTIEAVQHLDAFLAQISSVIDVDLMPGQYDPMNRMMPQQPWHKCMLPEAANFESMRSVTNPYAVEIGGVSFLGTSGQNLDDIFRYCEEENRLKLASWNLKWRHVAPTSPDTLDCYPHCSDDPFIIRHRPDVYFVGNQPEFGFEYFTDHSNRKVLICSLPNFAMTGFCALCNLKDLSIEPLSFAGSEDFINET